MASPVNTQDPNNPTSDDLNQQLRQDINDAYAFVEGSKTTQTFASLTFEDLMDAQIQRLTGPDTPQRPNPLNRIAAIATRTVDAVSKIKQLPPDFFNPRDDTDSANTPADGDDPYNDGTSP
jgi:hypothetical protein